MEKGIRIYSNVEYECIKSDGSFFKGCKYTSLMPGTLHDYDGDNMHISDEYFDEYFKN